ncbi:protein of unknown function [Marinitoga hydrogenitolerans DSM 16785]|uniref:DUF4956 domain-containing protein n=1 Tax=Marinitoga hydrogenitolerans (strain DSM 16785 / JCM 12826 / AT1271) TaxID=1122195 RepID=A0A1M4WDK6_MARH1|nr:DUF4956 domain-containing protein [Marinitoga hydrogenitolerans]SHE79304.1 protein of unknown function [Marinitoga hydrogenitolerans DSM 16785]
MNQVIIDMYNLISSQTRMNISIYSVLFTLLISFFEGLIIYFVYKKTYQGVIYVKSFNVSLIILSMITSMIVEAISSNFVLSFGMVGALSIIRFRTAIKDPLDTVFMFWAISIGIVNGGGFFLLGFFGTILISLVLIIMMEIHSFNNPYLLIINYDSVNVEKDINQFMKMNFKRYKVRSKNFNDKIEITYEIRIKNFDLINELKKIKGIENISLISYSGDYIETI